MKNIRTLRDELGNVVEGLKTGTMDANTAHEITNASGKIINSLKAELEYAALRKVEPKIAYLD